MTQACSICNHPKNIEISRLIVQGKNLSKLSREYGVSEDALRNHRDNHLSRQLVQAWEKKELEESMDLLNRLDDMIRKAENIFDRNYQKGKDSTALKALDSQCHRRYKSTLKSAV